MRRIRHTAAALTVALLAVLIAPWSAQAAGYQFWGYYHLVAGEWAFAVEGAGTTVPEDGTVQGLRFAVSSGEDMRAPRDVLEFDEVCADVPAEDGSKRVALVLDPGRAVDAPDGETLLAPGAQCVRSEPDATTLEIVQAAVPDVRTDGGDMICGLAGFPSAGCSEEVADPTPEQLAPDEPIEIPIVPVGTPILTPPTDQPAPEPTTEPTTEPTDGPTEPTSDDETTEDETTELESTDEGTSEDSTDPVTDDRTEDSTQEEGETAPAQDETQAPPSETPDDADSDEDSSAGIPPWAWALGVVVLLGILAVVATSARNRRLEAARWETSGDQPDTSQHWDDPGRNP